MVSQATYVSGPKETPLLTVLSVRQMPQELLKPVSLYQKSHFTCHWQKGQMATRDASHHSKVHAALQAPSDHNYLLFLISSLILNFSSLWASLPMLPTSPYNPAILAENSLGPLFVFISCLPPPRPIPWSLYLDPLLSWISPAYWPCSVCYFLSLLWTLPVVFGCSLPHIYNESHSLNCTMEQSCHPLIH